MGEDEPSEPAAPNEPPAEEPAAAAPAQLQISIRQEDGAALLVADGAGNVTRTIEADAGRAQDGYLVFALDPAELPNPFTLRRRAGDGSEAHLAGPCDPGALRDAIVGEQWDTVASLVGSAPADDDAAAPPEDAAAPAADTDDPISDGDL
jgi:hypothetical protein